MRYRLLRNSTSRCALGTRTVLAEIPGNALRPKRLLIAKSRCPQCFAAILCRFKDRAHGLIALGYDGARGIIRA